MKAWDLWARESSIAHAPAYFHDMFGRRNDAIIGGLLPDIAPGELQMLAARKEALFRESARGHLVALPGVLDLLSWLDERGLPRSIVTSTPRENLHMILDDLSLAGRFGALVAEEDASRGKPDPEGFLIAASRLGVEPARCIVIEDAPAGLAAAKSGGMFAIGVTTTHEAHALRDADLIVSSLDDAAVTDFIARANVRSM